MTVETGRDGGSGRTNLKLPDVLGLELSAILERRIVYLELEPGAHLTEQEISAEFGVSRSPVREALRELEATGLVKRLARRGVRITPMTQRDLEEIYFCRIPLEGLAAGCAAENATDEDVAFLEARLAGMRRAMDEGAPRDFFDRNVAFVDRLHEMTGNDSLKRILAIIEKQTLRYRYFAHVNSGAMLDLTAAGFADILEAVAARRPDRARDAATDVMGRSRQLIAAVLAEVSPDRADE